MMTSSNLISISQHLHLCLVTTKELIDAKDSCLPSKIIQIKPNCKSLDICFTIYRYLECKFSMHVHVSPT